MKNRLFGKADELLNWQETLPKNRKNYGQMGIERDKEVTLSYNYCYYLVYSGAHLSKSTISGV